jgi:hypothetical protein
MQIRIERWTAVGAPCRRARPRSWWACRLSRALLATATGLVVAAKAQRRGAQGVVMMNDVTLSRPRQVLSMAIAITSGHADLDAQAQAWSRVRNHCRLFHPRSLFSRRSC